jgi:hypothetical protein
VVSKPFDSMDFELFFRRMDAIDEKYKSINADRDARYELKMRQLEEHAVRMEQHADRMKSIQEKYSTEGNFNLEFGNQDVGQDFVQEDAEEEKEEEEENKMIQETNLVDDTHHAFDEIPQPS